MKLTGKCKKDFEKWYLKPKMVVPNILYKDGDINKFIFNKYIKLYLSRFYGYENSMRYGVLVDFFDSVNLIIDIHPVFGYDLEKFTKIIEYLVYVRPLNVIVEDVEPIECKTRPEAQTQAIKKADKMHNERNNKKERDSNK